MSSYLLILPLLHSGKDNEQNQGVAVKYMPEQLLFMQKYIDIYSEIYWYFCIDKWVAKN